MLADEKIAPHCKGCMNPLDVYYGEDACVCSATDSPGAYHVNFSYMGDTIAVNVDIGNRLSSEEMCREKAVMMATSLVMRSKYADVLRSGWCWTPSPSRANRARITRICWRNTENYGGLVHFSSF